MRPMFSYMGAKWRLAKYYGAPAHDTVIEPFAGSACYSLYWNAPKVILYDTNPIIHGIWEYLISVSESEIRQLPTVFETVDALPIPQEAKWLIGFWITKGNTHPSKSRSKWGRQYIDSRDCKVWGDAVKDRIARQLLGIRQWKSLCADYRTGPDIVADWFIDPPYTQAGKHYAHHKIEYETLREFCQTRQGRVTVCEVSGASWLPFTPFRDARAMTGKTGIRTSKECIYQVESNSPARASKEKESE